MGKVKQLLSKEKYIPTLIILMAGLALLIVAFLGNNSSNSDSASSNSEGASSGWFESSGKNILKDDYEVLEFWCGDISYVEMKSSGSRESQLISGFLRLEQDCPTAKRYAVTIIEPTRTCNYGLIGEVQRITTASLLYEDNYVSEESKKIIEEEIDFTVWKMSAERYDRFEKAYGISNMTIDEMELSDSYKDYLKNGITSKTAISMWRYELNSPINCE